jgi:integrase
MADKLTERSIERLVCPAGIKDRLVFDAEQRGLAVRVLASGAKSYMVQYSIGRQKRRVPLGSVQAISLAKAREAARAVMGQVAMGMDVAADRRAKNERAKAEAIRERMTLSNLVAEWKRLHLAKRRESYAAEAPRALERAFSDWWARPAERLDKAAVVKVLDKLSPSLHRAVGAYGRACFGWALKRGTVNANPFLGLPGFSTTKRRDRVLGDADLAKVWHAACAATAPYGSIVRVLLLTGQRREEVAGMAWEEISADRSVWTIPAERSKNDIASVVPLSMAVRDLLPKNRGKGLVFPGDGSKTFGNWSKCKDALDTASGVTGWRIHDIRRTVATGLQRLGVRLEVTEAILNHVAGKSRGVVGIYQRHDWATEKRSALEGWAAHVMARLSDTMTQSNLVRLIVPGSRATS